MCLSYPTKGTFANTKQFVCEGILVKGVETQTNCVKYTVWIWNRNKVKNPTRHLTVDKDIILIPLEEKYTKLQQVLGWSLGLSVWSLTAR